MNDFLREIKRSMGIYDAQPAGGSYGLLAEFANPGALLDAAKATHDAGYRAYDAHSPFPIHGMDAAMGLGPSKVSFHTLMGGITGLALATWLQWWTGSVDYPLNISGKPAFAVEPSVPVMFELTVLLAGLATAIGMLAMNGLPRVWNPLFYSKRFGRVTDDGFFLFVSADDRRYDASATAAMLRDLGATHVERIVAPADENAADLAETTAEAVPAEAHA